MSPTYGVDMNSDFSLGGTPVKVHNGIDDVLWTGSAISGAKFTFNSADQNHTAAGAQSVLTDNAAVGNIMQFLVGAPLDLSDYVALSLWVYVDSNWAAGDDIQIFGYDSATALPVGTSVGLQDYFAWGVFGSWHKVTIPLADMNLGGQTLDALRVQIAAKDIKSPKFYLDDIQWEETGTPATFTVEPGPGTWLHVQSLSITMADAMAGTLAAATMPAIAYNKLLGVSALSTGLVYRHRVDGEIIQVIPFTHLLDIIQMPGTRIVSNGSDGTNTWVDIEATFAEPIVLRSEDADQLSFTISDDLSGLLWLRVAAGTREEVRQ
jgi:hypothetical protein